MISTTLRYGIQKAASDIALAENPRATVGQHIEQILQQTSPGQVTDQLHAALENPQSIIELRAGAQVQTVTPDTPLRELLPADAEELEITVSQPHVGG